MYNINDIQKDFSTAQKFLNKFGASMQQNDNNHASKMLTFAMGSLQTILMNIEPKTETVYPDAPKKEVVIEITEPEIEITEEDFILSID